MSAEPAPVNNTTSASDTIIRRLIQRRATLRADVEYINDELATIDTQLIELLGTTGVHTIDGTRVEIREYTRVDYDTLATTYPADQYPNLYTTRTTLDHDAVRKQFAPAALDHYTVHGKKSVVIR